MDPGVRRDDGLREAPHDLNNLVYCVSCRMLARSARKVALPRSSSDALRARLAIETTVGSSKASTCSLSVWPRGTRRAPAEIQFDVSAWREACIVGPPRIACPAQT